MKLPEFSVHRRVSTTMIVMILVVVGLIAFSRLGLDFFPDIDLLFHNLTQSFPDIQTVQHGGRKRDHPDLFLRQNAPDLFLDIIAQSFHPDVFRGIGADIPAVPMLFVFLLFCRRRPFF